MPLTIQFNNGYVSARGREVLSQGEMQTATGIYFKPGDTLRAHKLMGRSTFGDVDTGSAVVKGLALCQFDTGTNDKLVASYGTSYYGATPGLTGVFSTLVTGLNSSATTMITAHYNDRWYLANGYDRMRVLGTSGVARLAGMEPPVAPPTGVFSSGTATVARPSSESNSGWTNPELARDTADFTFAYATASAPASVKTCTWSFANTALLTGRIIKIKCRFGDGAMGEFLGISPTQHNPLLGGYVVDLKMEVSINNGGAYTTLLQERRIYPHSDPFVLLQFPLTDGVNNDQVKVRASFTYVQGIRQGTFRIDDIHIRDAGDVANFTPDDPFYYAITEYDENEDQESIAGPALKVTSTTFVLKNKAVLTIPAAVNTRATHFIIYRTFDGGVINQDLGKVGQIPVSQTTWTDFFETTVDEEASPAYSMIRVGSRDTEEGELFYDRDDSPPALSYITAWKGSLVGLSREFPRALRYSAIGHPESWPSIYVITSFPLPERDELVAIVPCGDTLLILARGAVLTLTALPQALDGVFTSGEASPLRAAPGCVGVYAATAFSVAGEPRVAWVSTFGIYVSNGHTVARISDDLAWSSEVVVNKLGTAVLFWDSELQVLWFSYDVSGDGVNDRFFYAHMAPEHDKQDGISPKWSGPHYGGINCMTAGLVSSSFRVYSGHVSDGNVYLERGSATDASQSYSSTQVPLIVKTGRMYGEWHDWLAFRGNLRHTAFGSNQSCTLAWTWGRDSSGNTGTTTKTGVSLVSQVGTDFFIGRSGEWAELQITHTGDGVGALLDCRVDIQNMGKSGRVAV